LAEILGCRGFGERKNSEAPAVLSLLSAIFKGGSKGKGDTTV
jgi:hypothetical protein